MKKKTKPEPHQLFNHFTMGGAFGRRTGIRRKKTGRIKNVRDFCCSGLIFPRVRPHFEAHGGRSRSDTAQGPSNTFVRPAQGTRSRP